MSADDTQEHAKRLEKTQFVDLDRAIAAWNAHQLYALVAETDEVAELLAACKEATLSGLSGTEKGRTRPHVCLDYPP